MKKVCLALSILASFTAMAQPATKPNEAWKKEYRATDTKINALVHTKLEVSFNYEKQHMPGKAWITLMPHFYATDSLRLDAKGMQINKVALVTSAGMKPLKYVYNDAANLYITLDKTYKAGEKYTVYIDYVAKPNELKVQGSAAITDAKGLYFINPTGEDKKKPIQIWTQGETEATSVWCPTIDRPNQKTTNEIIMTVPDKYVTLSNGKLVSQKKNTNGTRTDHWKMELPHAPYLFFMGVGDYSVTKDTYKGKDVTYYVEPEYGTVARKIFGHTPEMMAFFSRITGVDFPWVKYGQMVARDYVSGAMENTTATLHQQSAQQDARELTEGNRWEDVIAHELFHQWFGDYVTCESWSNLTVNESFANYSETLWNEYKYGKDAGDAHNLSDMRGYVGSGSEKKDLVRFYYSDKEDMFDAVSYNKGGRILHMLRNYVGDSAFFKSLNLYLNTNKFKAAEAHQLRLAFEEVTGRDLNWFFNQWYFGAGHPKVTIDYDYNDAAKTVSVVVKQTQDSTKTFILPIAIDVYEGTQKKRHQVWIKNRIDTFTFGYSQKPDLVNVDGDKVILWEKKEPSKTLAQFLHQYKYAASYLDRYEALDAAAKKQADATAQEILKLGLADKYHGLRSFTIGRLDFKKSGVKEWAEPMLANIAEKDAKRTVKADAVEVLGSFNNEAYKALFTKLTQDSSYTLAGNALEALYEIDSVGALTIAKQLSTQKPKGKLGAAINSTLIRSGDFSAFDDITASFKEMGLQEQFNFVQQYADMIGKLKDNKQIKEGVDAIVGLRNAVPEQYRSQTDGYLNNMILKGIASKLKAAGNQEMNDYILKAVENK
jgi:aminopeptidase N